MSEFGSYRYPVGRKDHRCEWCGEPIPMGEKHTQYVGMWENEFQNWRMHNECFSAADHEDMEDGFTPFEHERPVCESTGS